MILPETALKGEKKNWHDLVHIIAAPALPKFNGYVMMINDENLTRQKDGTIKIFHGNEWNSTKREFVYMFELEEKIPGKRSKRFRYSENEVIALYGRAKSSTFDERYQERKQLVSTESGRLILASYSGMDSNKNPYTFTRWMISPDKSDLWAYELDYDPLRNTGKHRNNAKGFSILEEYHIDNLSVLWENRIEIKKALDTILEIRNVNNQKYSAYHFYPDRHGERIKCQSPIEDVAITAMEMFVPECVREEKLYYGIFERKEITPVREKLMELSKEMQAVCQKAIDEYKQKNFAVEDQKIYDLIGIHITF